MISRLYLTGHPAPVTAVVFTAGFAGVATLLNACPPDVQHRWLLWLSTNLDNLSDHPVRALIGSAFVSEDSRLDWVFLALIGLASAGRALGNLRLAGLVAACHVFATGISEGLLGVQIQLGVLPPTARAIVDVGPSFVVLPALVVGMLLGSWLGRIASAVAFVALEPHLFVGLSHLDFSAVGHLWTILIAVACGPPLARSWARSGDPLHLVRTGRTSRRSP